MAKFTDLVFGGVSGLGCSSDCRPFLKLPRGSLGHQALNPDPEP